MQHIQCPAALPEQNDRPFYWPRSIVFVAGGISNCPDWQKEMVERFKHVDDDLMLLNPRRNDFDVTDPAMSAKQIEWEYDHLHRAEAVLFWFPFHTLCPITLYELGVQAAMGKTIFVGCHPAYQRKFDVEHQLSLIRPDVKVHDNFQGIVDEVIAWHDQNYSIGKAIAYDGDIEQQLEDHLAHELQVYAK